MNAETGLGSELLDALASAIGEDAVLKLGRSFGGTQLHVPKKIGANHPIAVAIGGIAAGRLAEQYGGELLQIPRSVEIRDRRRLVVELGAKRTLTRDAIARETGLSRRRVYQILAEEQVDEQQLDLFDPRP